MEKAIKLKQTERKQNVKLFIIGSKGRFQSAAAAESALFLLFVDIDD